MTAARLRQLRRSLVASVLAMAVAGCSIEVVAGRVPDVSVLETVVKPGESTRADVMRVLGTPVGRSVSAMPIEAQPREMWTYYYNHGSLKDVRQLFLFVYFVEDRYDGYLWFSSVPEKSRP